MIPYLSKQALYSTYNSSYEALANPNGDGNGGGPTQNCTNMTNSTSNLTYESCVDLPVYQNGYVNYTFDNLAAKTTLTNSLYDTSNSTLFMLRLNVKNLINGKHFALCTDLDGYTGPQFMGDSGFALYTAVIPNVY